MTVDLPVADMPVSNTRFTSASYESVRARNGGARARLRHASAQYARPSVDRLIPPGWRGPPIPHFRRPWLAPAGAVLGGGCHALAVTLPGFRRPGGGPAAD